MKKMILSAVLLLFAASGYAQQTGAAGAGERNEWLPTFEAVAVDADLDIKFVRVPDTEAPKIVYDTKGSYTTKFRAEVRDKTLRITEKSDSRRPQRTEVTVYYNALRAVSLSGAAATFEGTLDAPLLDVTINRKASLTAKLNVQDLRMEQAGYSNSTLSGSVRYLTLYVSTGKVSASDMEVMSAQVNAQSKAEVALWITDRFVGKTTTNARITYKGDPKIVRGGAKFMGGEINRVE